MEKKREFAKDLRRIVFLWTTSLLLVIAIFVGVISYKSSVRESIKVMQAQLERFIDHIMMKQNMAEHSVVDLASYFWDATEYSQETVTDFLLREHVDKEICEKSIYLRPEFMKGQRPYVPYVSYWEQDSVSISRQYIKIENYIKAFEFFCDAVDPIMWVGPYLIEGDKNPYLGCIHKVVSEDGTVLGFTEVLFEQDGLADIIDDSASTLWHLDVFAGDSETRESVKALHFYEGMDMCLPLDSLAKLATEPQKFEIAGREFYFFKKGMKKDDLAVVTQLTNGWYLKLSVPYALAFKDTRLMMMGIILFFIFGLVVLGIIVRKVIDSRTQPIIKFSEAAADIADIARRGEKEFETSLPDAPRNDEIRTLRDSFSDMQSALKKYSSELEATSAAKARMESELGIGRDIQQQILKKTFPVDSRFDLSAFMLPAREVGGDMYDFELEEDRLYFMVGDVSGKGVPAALIMTVATSMFRHLTLTTDIPLNSVVAHINDTVAYGNDSNMFLTVLAGMVNLSTLEMTICNAGHNPMLVKNPGSAPVFIRPEVNSVCGVFGGLDFIEEKIQLMPGSRVLLYTDGVTEAINEKEEEYGEARLVEWAGKISDGMAQKDILADLSSSVKTFAGTAVQSDDITMLGLTIR